MRTRVTAILVARHGGEWLNQTLAAIAAQTREPDRVIAVVNGGRESLAHELRTQPGISGVVSTQSITSFGAAVQQGVAAVPSDQPTAVSYAAAGAAGTSHSTAGAGAAGAAAEAVQDWFWLLTEDSAPEPSALAEILSTVQRAPSVAVAGPKLLSWDHPDRIIELGQSLTRRGERWLLRRQERDQQQYDHLQDVLGVGPVGMLVRADVWRQLEGFDPAYSVYDDGLDLSVRARLAGFRVVVAPTSRIRFAQLGVAGPRIERSRRVMRTAHREARTAQLHRRISYAPAIAAFFMWLGLPLFAVLRVAWALIREQPGNMWGEFASTLKVFFTPGSITASRRRVHEANTAGWGAVKPLRIDTKSVRTARMIDREAILVSQGRMRDDLHFISSGGLAVLLASVLIAIGLTWWAITQTSLSGGSLAPLSPLGELWANTRTQNGVPADPFTWVLALLGTVTFWNPSHGVVIMLVAAIPLASLGGWIWAAQLTKNSAGRALLALAWAFSPVLLGSLAAGRLPTLILAVVLPWLLLAATRARTSWSWAGTASLLAAIALACAPILIPAGIVLLIVGIAGSPRGTARVLTVAIAPLALFAPKLLLLLRGSSPFDLLIDPGVPSAFTPGSTWHLLLGFPEFGLEGWGGIFAALGLNALPATTLVGVLLLPIVLLAALGLVTGRVHFTLLHAVLGGVGLLTAVGASKLQLLSVGSEAVSLWTGSGLALYWIAVLGLAAVGTTTLRKAATPVVAVGVVMTLVAVAPLGVKLATANTEISGGDNQMPALVQAAGAQNPELRTLVLTATGAQSVRAQLVTGAGLRLDEVRTAAVSSSVTEQDDELAALVGALASTGDEARTETVLAENGIGFVLLASEGESTERSQLQSAFDQQTALESAGQTAHGLLWRVAGETSNTVVDDENSVPAWFAGMSNRLFVNLLWWAQVIVLGAILLLALPTGEVVDRPQRRKKNGAAPGGDDSGAGDSEADDAGEGVAEAAGTAVATEAAAAIDNAAATGTPATPATAAAGEVAAAAIAQPVAVPDAATAEPNTIAAAATAEPNTIAAAATADAVASTDAGTGTGASVAATSEAATTASEDAAARVAGGGGTASADPLTADADADADADHPMNKLPKFLRPKTSDSEGGER